VDLHAHPSLKTSLFGLRWDQRHRAGSAFNPLSLRCDLPSLVAGGVDVLCSAVYVPERGLLDACLPLRAALVLVPHVRHLIEGDPYRGAMRVLDEFERIVAATPAVEGVQPAVAHSPADLAAHRAAGRLAVVHTLEGAHHLAGDPANVARFHARGVAMLTLAHFYPNGVAPPVDGIPPAQKHFGCFRGAKDLTASLTPLGRDVVEDMVHRGMLVDLTHCTSPARQAVFDLVGTRAPLVMSHVGAASCHPDPMNPMPDEVRRIADSGGVIGVIAMDYWLGRSGRSGSGDGIALMVRTMRALVEQGGIDVVALGSDFDGFTDPPDDLPDPSSLPRLTEALLADGFTEPEVEKILGRNALRVLAEGWRTTDSG
jgi:membrane dipeptidase